MQAQQAPLIFADAERTLGERLMKLALETDRVEGYTEPHAVMIARLAESIGKQVGLHGQDLTALKFAALAHDIGERGLKRNYLLQPNALSWEETLDLWRHPILGEQSAAELQLPRQTQLLIRWHQEWWNGQGYPDGLAGAAIPVGARILRAVDSYCALISQRPYRQRYELPEAEQIIADLSGIEFDPQIAKLLLAVIVAERRQREAEVWSIPPAFETPFTPMAEDMPEPAIAASAIDREIPQPMYASDADTLTDFAPDEYQPPPAVKAAAAEHQMPPPTGEPSWPSPEERTPAVQAESEAVAASAAPVELEESYAPPTEHVEALTAAPYGDVLMHQAADDEPPMQDATDEAPLIAHHNSTPDDQQEPALKIPS
jgi:hypothetical protein